MSPPMEFRNPLSGTTYRCRAEDAAWRITKTVHDSGIVAVRHLRGSTTPGVAPPADAVDRLVRGQHQRGDPIAADPVLTFAEVVLVDLDRTSTVLTALAREAHQRRLDGAPGFRPGCRPLRQQEEDAMARAVDGCRTLAAAWAATGMVSAIGLPNWLAAALGDLPDPATVDIASP